LWQATQTTYRSGLKARGVSNNFDFFAERAVGIANYLASHGVKADLIFGPRVRGTDPVASNDTPVVHAHMHKSSWRAKIYAIDHLNSVLPHEPQQRLEHCHGHEQIRDRTIQTNHLEALEASELN
jgi:hypothetical protein